ncbi:MAG: hypothetical protein WB805_03140 [Candidatus Dormiibacterota bacterium]
MRRIVALVLRVASVPVGVAVGLWTAQLATAPFQCPPKGIPCLDMAYVQKPIFATWQCILFGAGAAAVVLLLSFAVPRLPSAVRIKAS